MATLRTVFLAMLVLSGCDGGNVTTTNNQNQTVNVGDTGDQDCNLYCSGKADVVEVTEVCDGEVVSVTEVPLAMVPARCQSAPADGETPGATDEPASEPTAEPTLASPSGGSAVFG